VLYCRKVTLDLSIPVIWSISPDPSPLYFHPPLRHYKRLNIRLRISTRGVATDAAIDKLVYELYGLTEEEIAIVVGK
jgi:hypothetical protein